MGASSLAKNENPENYVESINNNRDIIKGAANELLRQIESGEAKEAICPVTHRFAPNLYLREIFMPAGTQIIGKIHATEHFNILLSGKVTVITAEGVEYIESPHTFISKAGVQKVVIVHEDCSWQTTHVTNETDLEKIENEVVAESYGDLLNDGLLDNIKGLGLCLGD